MIVRSMRGIDFGTQRPVGAASTATTPATRTAFPAPPAVAPSRAALSIFTGNAMTALTGAAPRQVLQQIIPVAPVQPATRITPPPPPGTWGVVAPPTPAPASMTPPAGAHDTALGAGGMMIGGSAPSPSDADLARYNSQIFYASESRQGLMTAGLGAVVAAGGGVAVFKGHEGVGVLVGLAGAVVGYFGVRRWMRASDTYQKAQQAYAASQAGAPSTGSSSSVSDFLIAHPNYQLPAGTIYPRL